MSMLKKTNATINRYQSKESKKNSTNSATATSSAWATQAAPFYGTASLPQRALFIIAFVGGQRGCREGDKAYKAGDSVFFSESKASWR